MRLLPILSAMLLLAGCVNGPRPESSIQKHRMEEAGFTRQMLTTGRYDLLSYHHITRKGEALELYLEGDGRSWVEPNMPALDPSPINPLVMNLARMDEAANVAYLARPCQFVGGEQGRGCSVSDWTDGRFSPEAVAAMMEAIQQLMRQSESSHVHLTGYSGGGTMAALIAARMPEVASFRTIAAPLELNAWVALHGLTPLQASLDPSDDAPKLASIPQHHWLSEKDKTVPPAIGRAYQARLGDTSCSRLEIVAQPSHDLGWEELWKERKRTAPTCQSTAD